MPIGGKRPGAGRKPGIPNKITADIRALAQKHAPDAMKALVRLAQKAESESARVSAANSILDRAYGKPRQEISGPNGQPIATVDALALAQLTDDQLEAYEEIVTALYGQPADGAGRAGSDQGGEGEAGS